jgi:NADH-quinone oxidoreductase subunit J
MPSELTFFAAAAIVLACAVAAVTLRHLVHAALCAAGAFAGVAAIYLQLNAEFLGVAQLLVYVGAIAILIVFVILLTSKVEALRQQASSSALVGVAAAVLLFAGILLPIAATPSLQRSAPTSPAAPVRRIGQELATHYVVPLQMVGILLTAAMLGAVVISMRDEQAAAPARAVAPTPSRVQEEEVVNAL